MAWKHPLEGLRFGMSDRQRQEMYRETAQMNAAISLARFILWVVCPILIVVYWLSR